MPDDQGRRIKADRRSKDGPCLFPVLAKARFLMVNFFPTGIQSRLPEVHASSSPAVGNETSFSASSSAILA